MKITAIPFVGHPVTDIDRARQFYETVLGLEVSMLHPLDEEKKQYWIEYEIGAEHCLAISNVWPPNEGPGGPTIALEVEDLETAFAELKAVDAIAEHAPSIMESPVCRFLFAQDPDGNPLMIHQAKSEAETGSLDADGACH